jgi:Flp pilus assembly CpaF family ATPase
MDEREGSPEEVVRAEEIIRDDFQASLDEFLRQRGLTRPEPSDDRAIYGFAEAAARRYHNATAYDPALPKLSNVQLWEIRQRLYLMRGPMGPLADLLSIQEVEDIHIHGTGGGFLVFGDHKEELPPRFNTEEELNDLVRYYAELAGKHFDPAQPVVTVTLRDGSRLNAVMAPLSKPPMITVRKQQLRRFLTLASLVEGGAVPPGLVPLLEAAVLSRLNIVISGGTGAGKTTLARVLAMLIPNGERTCVLESETELMLHELRPGDFFSLEAREANIEGAGEVTLGSLFRFAALRQRPDRIVVGEVRGDEAMDMLDAIGSGHDGTLTTIHASNPRMALSRLEGLATRGDVNLAPRVARQMVGASIDLILHLSSYRRGGDTVRRVARAAFVDENLEDPEGRPGVFEFCRYVVRRDDWEIDDHWGLHPPAKVEEKLLMAGLDLADLRPREAPV